MASLNLQTAVKICSNVCKDGWLPSFLEGWKKNLALLKVAGIYFPSKVVIKWHAEPTKIKLATIIIVIMTIINHHHTSCFLCLIVLGQSEQSVLGTCWNKGSLLVGIDYKTVSNGGPTLTEHLPILHSFEWSRSSQSSAPLGAFFLILYSLSSLFSYGYVTDLELKLIFFA